MPEKKLHLQLFEKLQVQLFETPKNSGNFNIFIRETKSCRCNFPNVAGATFFFACAFSSSPVVENSCSARSLMLECADAIYNRGFDAVGFTSLIHIFGEGFKNCQAALCIPLWKLSPICVLPTVAAPRLRPRWLRPRLLRLRCASLL